MEIKKFYSLIEVESEVAFLERQKNYILTGYENDTYIFKEETGHHLYAIVMSDEEVVDIEGYDSILVLPSKFHTWIHYLVSTEDRRYVDYQGHAMAAQQVVNRFDKFSIVILVSLVVFGIYAWYQSQSYVYVILILAGVFGVGLLLGYRAKYKKFIQRIESGDYDMN